MDQTYQVKLDAFEGPLDLLLHLINRYEIDIYDIPVAQITEQYMDYIHHMQYLELNVASEYLVMAATLLALKSRMLLPTEEVSMEEDDYEQDPRAELRERLIEYRQFKNAAESLQEKEGHATFTRARAKFETHHELDPTPTSDVTIYDMLGAIDQMLARKKWNKPLLTTIERTEIQVEERMREIICILENMPQGIHFEELFIYPDKSHIVATFIALLELMRNHSVTCLQEKHFSSIHIQRVK